MIHNQRQSCLNALIIHNQKTKTIKISISVHLFSRKKSNSKPFLINFLPVGFFESWPGDSHTYISQLRPQTRVIKPIIQRYNNTQTISSLY